MYQTILGLVFQSSWERELAHPVPISWRIELPSDVLYKKSVSMETCQHKVSIAPGQWFIYSEPIIGVYVYALYKERCDMHNGCPWYWSSNPGTFQEVTGIEVAYVSGHAVRNDLIILPKGYIWQDESRSFVVKGER